MGRRIVFLRARAGPNVVCKVDDLLGNRRRMTIAQKSDSEGETKEHMRATTGSYREIACATDRHKRPW